MSHRILIIGDVHGKVAGYFDRLDEFFEKHSEDDELYSLQIGDFGFEKEYNQRIERFEKSQRYDIENHRFFGGNHDQYPIKEEAMPLGHFGEVPYIPDSFFVRGAKSIDEEARTVGKDWWPEEELNWKQSRKAIEEYIRVEPDHVFTHEAPDIISEPMFPSRETVSSNTGKLLSQMLRQHQPKTWTFGHWHRSKELDLRGTSFRCLDELETLKINV